MLENSVLIAWGSGWIAASILGAPGRLLGRGVIGITAQVTRNAARDEQLSSKVHASLLNISLQLTVCNLGKESIDLPAIHICCHVLVRTWMHLD